MWSRRTGRWREIVRVEEETSNAIMSWFPACIIHVLLLYRLLSMETSVCVHVHVHLCDECWSLFDACEAYHWHYNSLLFVLYHFLWASNWFRSTKPLKFRWQIDVSSLYKIKGKQSRRNIDIWHSDVLGNAFNAFASCYNWLTTTLKSQRYSGSCFRCFNCFREILAHDVGQLIWFIRIEPTQSSWTQKIH